MSHPMRRAVRREVEYDDPSEIQALGYQPMPARSAQSYRPEEPATLARRYSARYEPVRSGNYDDLETDFNPPPYEWGSTSLRHRLRDGEDYRPIRRVADPARERAPERDGFFGRLTLRQSVTLAGLVAVIAGGSVGLAATQIDFGGDSNSAVAKPAVESQPAVTAAVLTESAPAPAARKSILTASVDVSDVSGQTGQMIALPLVVEPERQGQKLAIRLAGLPDSAYLTAGKRVARDWILQPGQELDVKLVVPEAQDPQYQVEVAAIDPASGQLAAPAKQITLHLETPPDASEQAAKPVDKVVMTPQAEIIEPLPEPLPAPVETAAAPAQPAAAPVEAAAAPTETVAAPAEQAAAPVQTASAPVEATPAPAAKPDAAELLRKGDLLLKVGDLAAARQFFQEAFEQGAVEGAIGAAKSYDPAVYAELNVQGIEPDPAQALDWYQKAGAAGANTAEAVARLTKTP